jgi:UDP-N-acetylmuramoyl-tripeptide--D-alanyl-D-alanine ligase
MLKQFVLSYLRFFARLALQRHSPTIIGIAGSVGKSSTRNAIEAILKDHFKVRSVGNSETGIPLGILGMEPKNYSKLEWLKLCLFAPLKLNHLKNSKYLIAEMGIDDPFPPKNMEYLLTIIKPHIAIVLNESATHTQQFEKSLTPRQRTMPPKEKTELLIQKITEEDTKIITESGCQTGIYNADNYFITKKLTEDTKKVPATLLSFGETGVTDISFGNYEVSTKGTLFSFSFRHIDHEKMIKLHFPQHILPKEYREVFAASILASQQTGLTLEQIIASLEKNLTLPKGRSSLFKGIHNTLIIDSSYNASKSSTLAFLTLVKKLKSNTKRPVVFVFGDMRELGSTARTEHEEVAEKTVGIIDYLYLVGPLTREYVLPVIQEHDKEFKEVRWFDKSKRAGEFLKEHLPKDAIVLFKGSQNTIFLEEAIKEILEDKKDTKNLCRQSPYWLKAKNL